LSRNSLEFEDTEEYQKLNNEFKSTNQLNKNKLNNLSTIMEVDSTNEKMNKTSSVTESDKNKNAANLS